MSAEPIPDGQVHIGVRPRDVRDALLPEEVGAFDSDWRAALARASDSVDLSEVADVLRRWARVAAMTRADPEAHRRMLRAAAQAEAGEAIPTVPSAAVDRLIRDRLTR